MKNRFSSLILLPVTLAFSPVLWEAGTNSPVNSSLQENLPTTVVANASTNGNGEEIPDAGIFEADFDGNGNLPENFTGTSGYIETKAAAYQYMRTHSK